MLAVARDSVIQIYSLVLLHVWALGLMPGVPLVTLVVFIAVALSSLVPLEPLVSLLSLVLVSVLLVLGFCSWTACCPLLRLQLLHAARCDLSRLCSYCWRRLRGWRFNGSRLLGD